MGTLRLGVSLGLSYALTYFWRYPIFMLPDEMLNGHIVTLFGKPFNLQASFSLVFILGFGLGKLPAVSVMTSPFFFKHRLGCCLALFVCTMLCVGGGVWLFPPRVAVLFVFTSCFFQSWVYGGLLTYIEGRRSTERLLAVLSGFYIFAGNLSRGTSSLVLQFGVAPRAMPLIVGATACVVSCLLLAYTDGQPGPTDADIASRSKRTQMTAEERWGFCKRWSTLLVFSIIAYATMATLRSFRDFYTQQIFSAALGVSSDEVPSWLYFVVDVPGAVLSSLALVWMNTVEDHQIAICRLFQIQLVSISFALGSTLLFLGNVIGGVVWQISLGVGIYLAYALMQTPVFERVFAVTKTQGTCAFLVFLSDGCGYFSTVCLLLYQNFGPLSGNQQILFVYLGVLVGGAVLMLFSVAVAYWSVVSHLAGAAERYTTPESLEPLTYPNSSDVESTTIQVPSASHE